MTSSKPPRVTKKRNATPTQPHRNMLRSFFLNASSKDVTVDTKPEARGTHTDMQCVTVVKAEAEECVETDCHGMSIESQECGSILTDMATGVFDHDGCKIEPRNDVKSSADVGETTSAMSMLSQQGEQQMQAGRAMDGLVCPACMQLQWMDPSAFEAHVNACLDAQTLKSDIVKSECVSVDTAADKDTKASVGSTDAVACLNDMSDAAAGAVHQQDTEPHTIYAPDHNKHQQRDEIGQPTLKIDTVSPTTGRSRACPWYKHIPGTTFTVDAFAYGIIPQCTAYFLTHFHSDHYGGLRKSFNHSTIYCSSITANLVTQQLGVDIAHIEVIPMDTKTRVQGVDVTFMDAMHCPGAVLILFEVVNADGSVKRHLHTGDFRAHASQLQHPALQDASMCERGADNTRLVYLDTLFLDTTYCKPAYVFPPQSVVIDAVCALVRGVVVDGKTVQSLVERTNIAKFFERVAPAVGASVADTAVTKDRVGTLRSWLGIGPGSALTKPACRYSDVLVVVGAYLIGKERVFMGIAREFGWRVYCPAAKRRVLACLENNELDAMLTSDPGAANVHVVGMGQLNKENLTTMLDQHRPRFTKLIAIRPTGWTFITNRSVAPPPSFPPRHPTLPIQKPFDIHDLKPQYLTKDITVIALPYSEHSSFAELEMFVRALNVGRVIPTVGMENRAGRLQMETWIQQWTTK